MIGKPKKTDSSDECLHFERPLLICYYFVQEAQVIKIHFDSVLYCPFHELQISIHIYIGTAQPQPQLKLGVST